MQLQTKNSHMFNVRRDTDDGGLKKWTQGGIKLILLYFYNTNIFEKKKLF